MNKKLIYYLCFVEGFAVMGIELLAGQMLAPLYGANLFSWTAVIGLAVVCMAAGYYTGGRISVIQTDALMTIKPVFLLSVIYTGLLILAPNKLAGIIYNNEHFYMSLFFTALLIILPVFLLAMLPPLLIKLLGRSIKHPGTAAGNIFFISTAGAIISCFITGFFLVPALGIVSALKIFFVLLLFTYLFISLKNKGLAAVFTLAGLVFLFTGKINGMRTGNSNVVSKSEGINGQLLVMDIPKTKKPPGLFRFMFINRMGQTFIEYPSGAPMWSYVDFTAYLCGTKGPNPKILLLGLGGGTVANRLITFLNADVDAVEFDPRIAEAAKKYFSLSKRVNIIIDDARHYINTCAKNKYDYVVFDLFKGEVPPSHVLTLESVKKVRSILKGSGALIINYNGFLTGEEGRATRSVIKTMMTGQYNCSVLPTPEAESNRNCLIIGTKGSVDLSRSLINVSAYGKPLDYNTSHIKSEQINIQKDHILTDDKPVLEHLNFKAGLEWRKVYYNNFTKKYFDEGLDLF